MGCGCGGNKRITNVTRNTSAKLPKQSIQASTTNNVPANNNNTIQSLAVKKDLTSDERAREKKRREIILKRLGRI